MTPDPRTQPPSEMMHLTLKIRQNLASYYSRTVPSITCFLSFILNQVSVDLLETLKLRVDLNGPPRV